MCLYGRDLIHLPKLVDALLLTEVCFQCVLFFHGGKAMVKKVVWKYSRHFKLYIFQLQ